jgi:hypothetical protein
MRDWLPEARHVVRDKTSMAITAADNSANRSTVLDDLFRLLLDCDCILLAADEGYDGALVSLAPIHTHRIF